METLFSRLKHAAGFLSVGVFILADISSHAQINIWTKSTSGNWEEPFWSLGTLPNSTQSVVIANSGWKAVAINAATVQNFPTSLTVSNLTVRNISPTDVNTLLVNYTGTAVPLRVLSGLSVQSGGRLVSLFSTLLVGSGQIGITNAPFIQDGGLVGATNLPMFIDYNGVYHFTNGIIHAGPLAVGCDTNGTFNQYGGALTLTTVRLGVLGPGVFNQYGGSTRMTSMDVGSQTPGQGSGTFNLHGGQLAVAGLLHVGAYFGSGQFFQFGGTNRPLQLEVAPFVGGVAPYYLLAGGFLGVSDVVVSASDFVRSSFEQSGGVHIVTNVLSIIGASIQGGPGREAGYIHGNGTLLARSIQLNDTFGYSYFIQSNGTTHVSESLQLSGGSAPYIGILTLTGGTLACANVSSGGGGVDISQTGGVFIVTNLFSYNGFSSIGLPRHPRYTFSGGTLTASNIELTADFIIDSSSQTGRISNLGFFRLAGTLVARDINEQLGRVQLAGHSVIDLTDGSSKLRFASSSGEAWSNSAVLLVTRWNGITNGGGADQIFFGVNSNGLTDAQLQRIHFFQPTGFSPGTYPARILTTGEVVPAVPAALRMAPLAPSLTLTWPEGWTLQTSTNVAGPYTDVSATSPYVVNTTANPQQFFRLRQ